MLGYHDSPSCAFDIWSPDPTCWGNNAIENRAFSPYCKHRSEVEEVVEFIASGATDIELDDDFDDSDIEYLEQLLHARGLYGRVSLS